MTRATTRETDAKRNYPCPHSSENRRNKNRTQPCARVASRAQLVNRRTEADKKHGARRWGPSAVNPIGPFAQRVKVLVKE